MITKDEVTKHILTDPFYEEVLNKYLKNKNERDEFRQELWLIILQMDEVKLVNYYNNQILKYIYIGIINNQIKSNTSPWHKKFRNIVLEYNQDINSNIEITNDIEIKTINEVKLKFIEDTLFKLEEKDPYLKRDITIFKMHIFENLSYRQIAKKTNISTTSIWKYVNNILFLIKNEKEKIKLIKQIETNDFNY